MQLLLRQHQSHARNWTRIRDSRVLLEPDPKSSAILFLVSFGYRIDFGLCLYFLGLLLRNDHVFVDFIFLTIFLSLSLNLFLSTTLFVT